VFSFQAPTSSTAASSGTSEVCTQEGFARDPNDLGIFYQCEKSGDKFIIYRFECPAGLIFDISLNVCNWKYLVKN
jgi:hypothetical protein